VPEPEVIEDNPEAATKLELALAYEEMGDREGARELLEEVLKEGSPAQRSAAQAKLESLG
jgi:pilus assembly protein FimV